MRAALALNHVAFEDLGSLGTELIRAGYRIELIDASTTDLHAIDPLKPGLLIVLGGPIGVYERVDYPFLSTEIDMIRSRLTAERRTIGICLGAQLIAAACGASVHPGANGKEIGWAPIHAGNDAARYPELSALMAPGVRVLHWHGDTFDLPADAHHLVATDLYPNQAFAIGRHALGLQFHAEVTARGLERWYVGHANELSHAGIGISQLRKESQVFAPQLEIAAQPLWQAWLRGNQ